MLNVNVDHQKHPNICRKVLLHLNYHLSFGGSKILIMKIFLQPNTVGVTINNTSKTTLKNLRGTAKATDDKIL